MLTGTGCFALIAGLALPAAAAAGAPAPAALAELDPALIAPEPHASERLMTPVRSKLSRGFKRAVELIHHNPSCRALFTGLDRDGLEALRYSMYYPAPREAETKVCRRGAIAFTRVGTAVTYLCPGFARLGEARAAFTLIHEALHHAGMGERPIHADGLTADQITSLVIRECR